MSIYEEWLSAKKAEQDATALRRRLEDEIAGLLDVSEQMEGTQTVKADGFKIKVTGRMNRRIDGDKLQEIAAENGLSDHLSTLFRWKPDINVREWKHADPSITAPLNAAITTTPGRPSFQITKED